MFDRAWHSCVQGASSVQLWVVIRVNGGGRVEVVVIDDADKSILHLAHKQGDRHFGDPRRALEAVRNRRVDEIVSVAGRFEGSASFLDHGLNERAHGCDSFLVSSGFAARDDVLNKLGHRLSDPRMRIVFSYIGSQIVFLDERRRSTGSELSVRDTFKNSHGELARLS